METGVSAADVSSFCTCCVSVLGSSVFCHTRYLCKLVLQSLSLGKMYLTKNFFAF